MNNKITIIGGNIAGLATAIAIKEKRPEINVTVYEKRGIWNKPCGAAISIDFNKELESRGIILKEAEYYKDFIVGSFNRHINTLESPFVITNREDLQEALIKYVTGLGVKYIVKEIKHDSYSLFTPQTIVATGYTGLTNKLLNRKWEKKDCATILRWDGHLPVRSIYKKQQIILGDEINIGYGWIFCGKDNHINIGYGAVSTNSMMKIQENYFKFIEVLNQSYGFDLSKDILANPDSWGIPIPVKKKKIKFNYFSPHGEEFIGVGDAVGMAHPVLAAGIEPAWLSGQVLANCIKDNGYIDTERYQKLLWKNQREVVMNSIDYYYAAIFRGKIYKLIPYFLKKRFINHLFKKQTLNLIKFWKEKPLYIPIT